MGGWEVHLRLIRMLPFAKDFFTYASLPFHNEKVATIHSAPTLFQTCYSYPGKEALFQLKVEKLKLRELSTFP